MKVAELNAAKGTVVEGKTDQSQHEAQRVEAHRVNFVRAPESGQLKVVTGGAVGKPLENGKHRPVVVTVQAAIFAVKCRTAKDAAEQTAAFARV